MPREPPEVRVSICSRYEDIDLVDLVTEASLSHVGLDERDVDRMSLAVREAVANGVKHGNRLDPEKRVEVVYQLGESEVVIQVTDEGAGFDREDVRDPLAPENLLRPSGRGILLMERLVDTIEFHHNSHGGTVAIMRQRVPADQSQNQVEEK